MATKYTPLPAKETQIRTPVFRLSFPSVFEPKENQLRQDKRKEYQITMIFNKDQKPELKPMYDLMTKVAHHRFGVGAKGLKNPFKDGDTHRNQAGELLCERNPAYKGHLVVASWSIRKPGVVAGDIDPKTQELRIITDTDEIYGGCFCKAFLNCYSYETAGNRGVAFGFLGLQKVKDGDPFGARVRAEDAFEAVEGAGVGSLAEETPAAGGGMFE